MVWLRSEQSLAGHPKTKRAARALGLSIPSMIGHLHCLWYWALDYAQDGSLSKYEPWEIADAALYPGEPDDFLDALKNCGKDRPGFLEVTDAGLTIHDWYDYAGCLIDARKANAERMKEKRAAHVQRTCQTRTGATERDRERQTNRENREKSGGLPVENSGEVDWVAAYVEARQAAGDEPSKNDKAVFGAKVKTLGTIDAEVMQDTIVRMIERGKGPPLLPFIYDDVKKESEAEIFTMQTGGGRRVR